MLNQMPNVIRGKLKNEPKVIKIKKMKEFGQDDRVKRSCVLPPSVTYKIYNYLQRNTIVRNIRRLEEKISEAKDKRETQ